MGIQERIQALVYNLRRLRWKAYLGLLFFICAIVMWFGLIEPNAREVQQLKLDLISFSSAKSSLAKSNSQSVLVDASQQFYASLPPQEEASYKIEQIIEMTKVSGLVSNRSVYTPQIIASNSLVKYQINIPVLGTYIQIRLFLNQVLNLLPSLALNEISFKRNDVNNDAVEANIQMTLYMRKTK